MRNEGIEFNDFDSFLKILDDYGGIKVYRDKIRLSGFGNPSDDWTGLDSMSGGDPSVIPRRSQVIAMVRIGSEHNPDINDTTTRENIIRNKSFQDMLKFVQDSITVFSQMRGEIENKRQPAPKEPNKYVARSIEVAKKNSERKPLLDFSADYPKIFPWYVRLEEEINICYFASQPNATLMLSRKMVENLIYNILATKFPKEIDLRFDTGQARAHGLNKLIKNLEGRETDFHPEQRDALNKLVFLVKAFRLDANSNVHNIIQYLENIDELDKLKITEIVSLELQILKKTTTT
jgi:hypothetical protein